MYTYVIGFNSIYGYLFQFAFILDCNVPEDRDAKIQKVQCLCPGGCKLNVCQMNVECSAAPE